MQQQPTYSFLDTQATLIGPGGVVAMGAPAGCAEEGITVEATEETDTMLIGADGQVAHSLHATKAGRVLVRLLKTSPVNSQLDAMYNLQRSTGLFHGKNILTIANPTTGDVYTCQGVAFVRRPTNNYAKLAGTIDWEFNASEIDSTLGDLGI